jgi:hypothetical protein
VGLTTLERGVQGIIFGWHLGKPIAKNSGLAQTCQELFSSVVGVGASPKVANSRENRRLACLKTGFRCQTNAHTGETPMLPGVLSLRLQLSEMRPVLTDPNGTNDRLDMS